MAVPGHHSPELTTAGPAADKTHRVLDLWLKDTAWHVIANGSPRGPLRCLLEQPRKMVSCPSDVLACRAGTPATN